MTTERDSFFERVYDVVRLVPYGRATTYGATTSPAVTTNPTTVPGDETGMRWKSFW